MKAVETYELTRVFKAQTSQEGSKIFKFIGKREQEVTAVDMLTFSVRKGELFGLLGPNGAGKTTTIKILSTLLLPTSGSAFVNGYSVIEQPEKVQSSIGLVLGGEAALYNRLTARDNLVFFSRLYGIREKVAKDRITFLLDLVDLTERADDRVERFSKGMKQKLHVARGLINDPETIFLDEPTLGLDVKVAHTLRRFIKYTLVDKQNKTVLLTTHYMLEAQELCDRVGIISKGRLVVVDTPQALIKEFGGTGSVEFSLEKVGDLRKFVEAAKGLTTVRHVKATALANSYMVKIYGEGLEDLVPRVFSVASKPKVRIKSVRLLEPNLEDVFLNLTGGDLGNVV